MKQNIILAPILIIQKSILIDLFPLLNLSLLLFSTCQHLPTLPIRLHTTYTHRKQLLFQGYESEPLCVCVCEASHLLKEKKATKSINSGLNLSPKSSVSILPSNVSTLILQHG